jgi:predicted glycoside hydrolase/deacetylase ChbG (UPF0249 family)
LRAEIEAQLARFEELTGRKPTHLDSHHHSHRIPVICEALIDSALELGIPVRDSGRGVGLRLRAAGISTTDAFVEEFFGPAATLEVLRRILGDLGPGTTEIMCHPAVIDDLLRDSSSYVYERETEFAALTDRSLCELLMDGEIELANFGTL